jgi:hypothetical protein
MGATAGAGVFAGGDGLGGIWRWLEGTDRRRREQLTAKFGRKCCKFLIYVNNHQVSQMNMELGALDETCILFRFKFQEYFRGKKSSSLKLFDISRSEQ